MSNSGKEASFFFLGKLFPVIPVWTRNTKDRYDWNKKFLGLIGDQNTRFSFLQDFETSPYNLSEESNLFCQFS